jgi:hypothetical protein
LQRRKLLDACVNASGAIRSQQNRVFDHQAAVFDGSGRGVTDKALALEVASRKARNFPDVLDVIRA